MNFIWILVLMCPIHQDSWERPILYYRSLIGRDCAWLWAQNLKGPGIPSEYLDYPNAKSFDVVSTANQSCTIEKRIAFDNPDGDVDLADWAYWTNLESALKGQPRKPLFPCTVNCFSFPGGNENE